MCKESPTPHEKAQKDAGSKVINQKEGGLIRIGGSIEVVVLKARDGHIRIVVRAPRNLEISAPKQ